MLTRSYEDAACRIARADNVLLSVWTELPTAARLVALRQAVRQLATEAGPVAGLVVISPKVSTSVELSDALRQELSAIFRLLASRPDALIAIVVDGAGFMGAALRSIFSGVMMVARVPYTTKILSSRQEGARAVIEHTCSSADRVPRSRALLQDLEALQAEIQKRA